MQDASTMRGPSTVRGRGPYDDGPEAPLKDQVEPPARTTRNTTAEGAPASRNAGTSNDRPAASEPGAGPESTAEQAARPGRGGGGGAVGGLTPGPGADDWEYRLGGCESGFTYPDPTDTNIIWASCYGNEVTRYDARTKEAHSVSPWLHTLDSPPTDTKYRCHWTPPLALDPFEKETVYYGCQVIFKTNNAGKNWSVISPDLSTKDPSRIVSSGGIVGDNLGQFYGEVVFAIAPSTVQKGLIWAGTNDGKVWYTRDGGGNWNDVTKNIAGLPEWGTISKIAPSAFDAGTAYTAVDAHLMDNRDPFIFKTTDFGKTWKQINSNLPKGPLAYVKSVAEDPNKKGLLFAGTGNGFYYSLDDGAKWTHLQGGLPHAPVTWIEVQKTFHDVVVSTYGRGIYILDDITPLEQTSETTDAEAATLYKPRPTYRLLSGGRGFINFHLKSGAAAEVKILNSQGETVREFKSSPAHAGLNRRTWDLHYDPPTTVKLRTAAPDNPFIFDEPRFRQADFRTITHWGIRPAEVGPLVTPGTYTVQLTVAGTSYRQPIEILKSPKTTTSDADLAESLKLQLRIRSDITKTSEMVNKIEWLRKQSEEIQKMLRVQGGNAELVKAAQDLDQKMQDVEFKLISRSDANSDDKYYVEAYKVYLNLIWLNGEVGTGAGDVAGGANYGPTDTSKQMLEAIEKDLHTTETEYDALLTKELPAFERKLSASGVMHAMNAGGR